MESIIAHSISPKNLFTKGLTCNEDLDYPPFWELEFHLWDVFSQKKIFLGNEFLKLSKKEKDVALYTNLEIISEISHLLGFSGINTPGKYWEIAPGKPAYYWLPDEYREKQIELLQKEIGNKFLIIVNTGGILAMPEASTFVDFSLKLFTDPDEIDEMAKNIYEGAIKEIDKYSDMGIEAFICPSDLGDTKSPYFSPDQMERFVLPYMQKWAEYINKKKGYSILHSDGNINIYMDEIANSGINALQAIDPTAGMDIVALQNKYSNKICLCGNLDVGMLNTEVPEKIYDAAIKLLNDCGGKGGFVFGASNAIQQEIPKENYQAVIDAYKRYTSDY